MPWAGFHKNRDASPNRNDPLARRGVAMCADRSRLQVFEVDLVLQALVELPGNQHGLGLIVLLDHHAVMGLLGVLDNVGRLRPEFRDGRDGVNFSGFVHRMVG